MPDRRLRPGRANKIILSPYDFVFEGDGATDELCVPLLRSQIKAIHGLLEPLRWKARWYRVDGDPVTFDTDTVDAWVSDLEYRLMSVCGGNMVDQTKLQLEIMAVANMLRAMADPAIYAPDVPTTTFDGTQDADYELRDAALCQAIRAYVYRLWRETSERYASVEGFTDEIPEWWAELPFPLVALTGGFALIQAAFSYAAVKTALQDADAREEVICQMYKRLKGLPVSAANFAAVFTGMPAAGYNASVLRDVLAATADRTDNYALFQQALSDGYNAAEAGAPNDCCGPDCGFDTTWGETTDGGRVLYGDRELGVGVRATSLTNPGSNQYEGRVIYYLSEECSADEAIFTWRNTGGSGSFNAYMRIRRASDQVWSPLSGGVPVNDVAWHSINGWGASYIPYDAIYFLLWNYTTGTRAGIIERTGVR